ncbi:hypothetical protein GGI07_002633 [Coemansia sp. Benny D115]|nr:hypothetical protein GGI07_002633 [Coemansia sp. Benny D115]
MPLLDSEQTGIVDPETIRISMASQQHRRKAVQYIPSRETTEQGEPHQSSNTAASTTDPVDFQPMRTPGAYGQMLSTTNKRLPPVPPQQATQQRATGSPRTISSGVSPRTQPLGTTPDYSKEDCDEEIYLRRVSALYHELWTSDWIDRQLFSSGPLSLCPESEEATVDTATGIFASSGDSSNDAPPDSRPGAEADKDTIRASSTGTTMQQQNTASENRAAMVEAQVQPEKPSTDMQTIAETIVCSDNSLFIETPSIHNSDESPNRQLQQTRQGFPELQSSWCSHDDETCAEQDSPTLLPTGERAPIPGFTSSDLADALIGTVHRLEDDKQLVRHKRWSVIKELATTEAYYLRDLLLLRTIFYEPLAGPSGNGLLRAEDVATIFGNLDQVIDCARSLVEYLTVAVVYEANRCCALGELESQGSNVGGEYSAKMERHSAMPMQWGSSDFPAPFPGANSAAMAAGAKHGDARLRSSAWADISIAQAFLLTSQKIERAYSEYCRNFEAASQRLIEIKNAASNMSASVSTPTNMPSTPLTMYNQAYPAGSPMPDSLKSMHGAGSVVSAGVAGIRASGNVAGSSVFSGQGNMSIQFDRWDPEDMYAAMVYQFMHEQSQLLSGKTTSWDLSSLLIKPVQRILKYPLLVRSLLGLTRAHTADRSRLEKAVLSIECIAEAINAVNNTSGLRISTVSGAQGGSATSDENQSRLTRELRRVLRRKPGTMGHARTKSNADSPAPLKPRMSIRPKSRAREAIDLPANTGGATSNAPTSGAEALVEQHELRIAELIKSLKRWESDLGSTLCQQIALVGRWRDFYATLGKNTDSAASQYAGTELPTTEGDLKTGGVGGAAAGVAPSGAGELLDTDEMIYREYSRYQRRQQIQHHVHQQMRYSESRRILGRQLEPRASRSHGALRTQASLTASDSYLPGNGTSARLHGVHISNMNYASSAGVSEERSIGGSELAWLVIRRDRAARYHAALEKVYKELYPKLICSMLHSSAYPVLNSLLQIYRDGPRSMLSDIARLSGANGSSQGSSANANEVRAAVLHNSLATDLPKLFEHERTIVRLLAEKIIELKREFYYQTIGVLSVARGDIDVDLDFNTPDSDISIGMTRHLAGLADLSTGAIASSIIAPLQQQHSAESTKAEKMKAAFDKKLTEPILLGPDHSLPSAAERTNRIQSGIWALTQELDGQSSSHYILKSRRRQSVADSTFSIDSLSDSSIVLYDYPATSVFDSVSSDMHRPRFAGPSLGTGSDPTLLISASRNASTFPPEYAGTWQHVSSPAAAPEVTTEEAKPEPVKPRRKKSIGLMDRLANFRSGKSSRNTQASSNASQTSQDEYGSASDQVKTRAQLGMSMANIPGESAKSVGARTGHRALSDAGLRGRDGRGMWSTDITKYEPLPMMDSIRFSKGFIDDTLQFLNTKHQDSVADKKDSVKVSSASAQVRT